MKGAEKETVIVSPTHFTVTSTTKLIPFLHMYKTETKTANKSWLTLRIEQECNIDRCMQTVSSWKRLKTPTPPHYYSSSELKLCTENKWRKKVFKGKYYCSVERWWGNSTECLPLLIIQTAGPRKRTNVKEHWIIQWKPYYHNKKESRNETHIQIWMNGWK